MSLWERHGFARLMDWNMRGAATDRLRAATLAAARGDVLEVDAVGLRDEGQGLRVKGNGASRTDRCPVLLPLAP